jgi:glycine hydroxymethyltransferase
MDQIAELMHTVLTQTTPAEGSKAKYHLDPAVADRVSKQATEMLAAFPLYPSVDLGS